MAAVVDPRRDVDAYLAAVREHDLRITHIVETHLHNDYVSGGRELAAATGAEKVIGPAPSSPTGTGRSARGMPSRSGPSASRRSRRPATPRSRRLRRR